VPNLMQREGKLYRLWLFRFARLRRFSHTERILPRRYISSTSRRELIFLKSILNRSCTNLFPQIFGAVPSRTLSSPQSRG